MNHDIHTVSYFKYVAYFYMNGLYHCWNIDLWLRTLKELVSDSSTHWLEKIDENRKQTKLDGLELDIWITMLYKNFVKTLKNYSLKYNHDWIKKVAIPEISVWHIQT